MGEVVQLDDHRPHVTVECDKGHVHVIPEALFRDLIAGVGPALVTLLGEHECVLRAIVRDWLELLEDEA